MPLLPQLLLQFRLWMLLQQLQLHHYKTAGPDFTRRRLEGLYDLVLGAVAPNPLPRPKAAAVLVGEAPSAALFLKAAELAFAATRSFDGQLVGSGTLIKVGNEDLNFGGSSPGFTGIVEIAGGALNLIWDGGSALSPLPNVQYFQTTAPGVLAVTVNGTYTEVGGQKAIFVQGTIKK